MLLMHANIVDKASARHVLPTTFTRAPFYLLTHRAHSSFVVFVLIVPRPGL